jgi:hypothetical protein
MTYSRRQLYALGEPLGDAVTRKAGGKTLYGGGGGGGAPTQQTITQSNIPDWLRPQAETVLGGAMQQLFTTQKGEDGTYDVTGVRPYIPYSANPADYVADFSPLQQQAMGGAAGLQLPGQFGAATQMSGMAGQGGLDVARQGGMYGNIGLGYGAQAAGLAPEAQAYGGRAADIGLRGLGAQDIGAEVGRTAQGYAGQQAGAGAGYAQMATDPSAMQSYMSPYMQNVVDVQQQAAQRQADIANQATQAQFARAGAFGGARHGIQQAQAAADLARQKQGIQAQGLQQAFQQAQQAQQFGAGLGLQGLAGAQQGLGNVLSGGQLGLQGIGQAIAGQQAGLAGLGQAGQMYGLGMQGAGMGLQGVGQMLGGYDLLGRQAGVMGGLGGQQLGAQRDIIGTQAQMGGMEQQRQQSIINQAISDYAQAQQYPLQQFNAYNALLRGYAIPGQTSTTYQAAPGLAQQAAGLGLGAAGVSQLLRKKGGPVKSMAEGGFAAIDDKVRNDPVKYSEEQVKRSAANDVINPQTAALALAEIARAKKAAAGLNALSSGLPAQGFAPGGIVAFEDGGKVERFQNQGLVGGDRAETVAERRYREWLESQQAQSARLQRLGRALFSSPERFRYSQQGDLGPGQTYGPMGEVISAPPKPATPPSTTPPATAPSAAAPAAAAPAAPPSPTGGVASLAPSTTFADITAQMQAAREGAVPQGLAGLSLEQLSPARLREMYNEAMPQGAAAYETPLTPMYKEFAEEAKGAAKERLGESERIAERLDKLRESQESRYRAKEKDLEMDRSRSVGIALLEAAQAMTQPGQSFMQGLTRSAAAGGQRLMAEKERLDQRADALTEALTRLDESRLGDARERAAAKAEYNKAVLDVRKSIIDQAAAAYGANRQDVTKMVDASLNRGAQVATFNLAREKATIEAQQGAERNAVAAAGAAAAMRTAEKEPGELQLLRALEADPKLRAVAQAMRAKEGKNIMELYAEWMKGAGPAVQMMSPEQRIQAFLAESAVLSGPRSLSVSSKPTGTVVNKPPQ